MPNNLLDPEATKRELRKSVSLCKWMWLGMIVVLFLFKLSFFALLACVLAVGVSIGERIGKRLT